MNLEVVRMELLKKPAIEVGVGAGRVDIRNVEQSLGITFPGEYREFIEAFGYAAWVGHAIYGICEDDDYRTQIHTLELRNTRIPETFAKVPFHGNVIETYGGGGCYFLFSEESPRVGEVALFLDELWGGEAQSWPSFEEFLHYKLSL